MFEIDFEYAADYQSVADLLHKINSNLVHAADSLQFIFKFTLQGNTEEAKINLQKAIQLSLDVNEDVKPYV